jgi:nucleoside-diphosphate-sugar epimerase
METVLLTGATGFLGSHLLESLVRGNYKVIILKRSFSNTWRIGHLLRNIKAYDINTVTLEHIFRENKVDVIIHAATTYGRRGEANATIAESNILLPLRLLDLSMSYHIATFINTDSYFNIPSLHHKYLSCYSLSKHQLIEWLKLLSDKIQVINLKLEHIYGPKDSHDKFVMWLIQGCIHNEAKIALTEGHQTRDFIYVSDVVNAFLLVMKRRGSLPGYSEFEVGTGESIAIRDFAKTVKSTVSEVLNREVGTFLDFGANPSRKGEIMESKADISALTDIGWNCKVSLQDGLQKTIKSFLSSGNK